MRKVAFGNTGMMITPIGFGAWAIGGGGWEYAWGPQDDDDSTRAIHRALDLGINWIDTAAVYGLGHSEEVVGKAVRGMAEKPYIFTKCELVWDKDGNIDVSLKADSIRREVEASLRRLQVETIDLYQIHWPDPEEDIEEGWQTLVDLKAEGKVQHIGVSNFDVEQLRRAQAIAPVETLQPPYSLLRRGIEDDILPYCAEHNIGVIVYSPMYSGLLTGAMTRERVANFAQDDWRRSDEEFQEPRLTRNLQLADILREVGAQYGRSAAAVSVAWTLRHPAVTAAIVGARRADQVDGFIGAAEFDLSDADAERIETFLANNPVT